MKILYVLDFFHPHVGGVPTMFRNIAENMADMGHKVTIVTSHADNTKSFEKFNGIKIHRIGKSRESFMFGATMFLLKNREKFDIVHTSTYSAMVPSFAFNLFKKVPEILSVHEVWSLKEWNRFTGKKGPFYFMEERALFKLPFDVYLTPSEHTRKDLKMVGVDESRVKVIPHGIDTKIFNASAKKHREQMRSSLGIENDEIVGCFVGKATKFKGINYLLNALEIFLKNHEMKFIFLLSKSHKKGYDKFMKRVHESETLKDKLIIAQPSSDHAFISRLVGCCDFLAMPSLTEGFGFAAAEAASIGIPVIATRATSLTEVVDERNAIFVNPRSTSEIVRAIRELYNEKSVREKLSKGRKYKAWKEVSKEYVKVYEDTIRKHNVVGR